MGLEFGGPHLNPNFDLYLSLHGLGQAIIFSSVKRFQGKTNSDKTLSTVAGLE